MEEPISDHKEPQMNDKELKEYGLKFLINDSSIGYIWKRIKYNNYILTSFSNGGMIIKASAVKYVPFDNSVYARENRLHTEELIEKIEEVDRYYKSKYFYGKE